MRSNGFRHDDPVYYQCELKGLITTTQENGLKIQCVIVRNNIQILFKSDNGECAGVVIPVEL